MGTWVRGLHFSNFRAISCTWRHKLLSDNYLSFIKLYPFPILNGRINQSHLMDVFFSSNWGLFCEAYYGSNRKVTNKAISNSCNTQVHCGESVCGHSCETGDNGKVIKILDQTGGQSEQRDQDRLQVGVYVDHGVFWSEAILVQCKVYEEPPDDHGITDSWGECHANFTQVTDWCAMRSLKWMKLLMQSVLTKVTSKLGHSINYIFFILHLYLVHDGWKLNLWYYNFG